MKIQNPHDRFFKETLGKVEVAKDFLNNYLPGNIIKVIDVDTLEPQKDSFINKELQEGFSDLLFKANINNREGYIYFLFEHKSYTRKDIAFQLLRYMMEIWETKSKKEKADELPVIIPLVVYHGKDRWKIGTTLGEMIVGYKDLPEDIKKFTPNYEYSKQGNGSLFAMNAGSTAITVVGPVFLTTKPAWCGFIITYLPGGLLWYDQIESMAAKIAICILAAILLYGAGILFWLAIISALVILIAGFAGAYIDEKNR